MREIIFDTETTGLSHKDGHRIIEIGAVEMVNKYRTGESFHVYVNPKRDIDPGAQKVHGITSEFLQDKPEFHEVIKDFLEFVGDAYLVAHNAAFDIGFLNNHLYDLNIKKIRDEVVIDTLQIARKKYPGQKNSLDALCSRLNVDASSRVKHGALLDAELLADVYAEMMGVGANQKNLIFAKEEAAKEEKEQESTTPVVHFGKNSKSYDAREFALTEEEEKLHAEFLKKLKNPVWGSN